MAVGRVGRKLIGSLLAVNAVAYSIVLLGLAGFSLDKYIDGQHNHPHYNSTILFLRYALAGSAIGVCSVFLGCVHLRVWNRYSLASAASLHWRWLCLLLSTDRRDVTETSGKRKLPYPLLLGAGMYSSRYGPAYDGEPKTPQASCC